MRARMRKLAITTLGALGVVYGDIGTSPLYAMKECLAWNEAGTYSPHAVVPSTENVLGVLSLMLWSIVLVVCVKYIAFVLRADDYLTKPFGTSELLARIRVALRHARRAPIPDDPVLVVGPIRIDGARRQVTVEDAEIHLTPLEFKLLAYLARHAGKVLTHRQLLQEVWGPQNTQHHEYLRVHMAALRRKIEHDSARPRWLMTEAGVGYRMRDD